MHQINERLYNWASILDDGTRLQAERLARLKDAEGNPLIAGHVALMPDAHLGAGATVGSVIPTENIIIPAAVGVDIGCGMIACELSITARDLPESLEPYMKLIEQVIPSGVGKGRTGSMYRAEKFMNAHKPYTELSNRQMEKTLEQFGTLGSGNHFFEVCLDERDVVWLVLHSGSRGIGNELAQVHIKLAQELMSHPVEDKDLAYFTQGTPQFKHYVLDMLWAQEYAYGNREAMMQAALWEFSCVVGSFTVAQSINCHHNYTEWDAQLGLYITRKGAIDAHEGSLGIIPGSMGAASYIVRGLGNLDSYNSCSHGAGRTMSRTQAKKNVTEEQLAVMMAGKVWNSDNAKGLLDEAPPAYKDIDVVMEDQKDLVEIVHTLHQILNYKGA